MIRIVLLAALLGGCLGWETGQAIRPESDDPDQLELWTTAINHAADAWQLALGDDCPFPFPMSEDGLPVRLVDHDWGHGTDHDGWTTNGAIEILDCGNGALGQRGILMHEFGHAFGLGHQRDELSIMHPSVSYTQLPTTSDVARARASLGCR